MKKFLVAVAAIALLSGCGVKEKVVDTSTTAIAKGIDEACERGMSPLGIEARKTIVDEINAKTNVGNHTPSDCDSDGLPDFAIDNDGLVVR